MSFASRELPLPTRRIKPQSVKCGGHVASSELWRRYGLGGCPQFFTENAEILPWFDRNHFLPNPFQFFISGRPFNRRRFVVSNRAPQNSPQKYVVEEHLRSGVKNLECKYSKIKCREQYLCKFYIFLTVHLRIILVIDQLDAQFLL